MKLTPFGQVSRKLRIDYQMTLKDMAEKLGTSSAYVSAIEVGKKVLTENIINKYIEILCKSKEEIENMRKAADETISSLNINLNNINEDSRGLVVQFSRKINSLSSIEKAKIIKILNKSGGKNNNE